MSSRESSTSSSAASDGAVAEPGQALRDLLPTGVHKRLVIRDLLVDNFKSYAGRHRIGPFHKTFTAVIGPNGSGKSNVIDAMLFVFGKQAKKIRLEKLSELIHTSAAFPNLTSAAVTVTFVEIEDDPKDHGAWTEIPGSAIAITREVQRSGTSQYFLNGTKTPQKEVVSFLISKGVDLEHNRFLILQGEVEQIALMKPKAEKEGEEGLLEYFDDLIGTNRYIDAIKEATTVVEQCQEERLASLDALEKVRKEREALEASKQQTIAYATKDNQVQFMMSIMCQMRIAKCEEELIEPRQKIASLDEDLADLQERMRVAREKLQEQQLAVTNFKKEVARHEADKKNAKEDLDKIGAEVETQNAEIAQAEKQRKKHDDKLKKHQEEIKSLILRADEADRDAKLWTAQLEAAEAALEKDRPLLEQERERLQAELAPLMRKLDELRKAASPFAAAVAEAKEALLTAQQEVETIDSRTKSVADELAAARDKHAGELAACNDLKRSLAERQRVSRETGERLAAVEKERDELQRRSGFLSNTIHQINQQNQDEQLDDKVSACLANERHIGYHGMLRQLGKIDDQYDVAAGVAGGGMWGYHVVEDQAAATAAMNILRQRDLGRASFIPLDKVSREMREQMREAVEPPRGCQRLFDLIQAEERFAPALYFAVRNTLVCDELQLARKIGLGGGRARVVTLRGELVEPGVVTGGGGRPQGARLRGGNRPADVAAMAKKLKAVQEEKIELDKRIQQLMSQQHQLADNARQNGVTPQQEMAMTREVSLKTATVEALSERIEVLVREAQRAESQTDARESAVADCTSAQRRLEAAEAKNKSFAEQIQQVEQQKNQVGGPEFDALKSKVDAAKKQAKDLANKILTAQNVFASSTQTRKRREQALAELEKSIEEAAGAEEAKAKLVDLKAQEAEINAAIRKIEALADTATLDAEEAKGKCERIENAITTYQDSINDLNSVKDEVLEGMRAHLEAIEKFEIRIKEREEKTVDNVLTFGPETWTQRKRAERINLETGAEDQNPDDVLQDDTEMDDASVLRMFEEGRFTTRASDEELAQYDRAQCTFLITQLSEEMKRAHDRIDFDAVKRWQEKDALYKERKTAYDDLLAKLGEAESSLTTLKNERRDQFMSVFKEIQLRLKQMYQLLANGGDAEIELLDTSDPFEGINFVVRPPKKAWKNVSNLSGGEKTLSSLALVFALHHVKPTPVYVMDEIDAALDFRNVSIVARYVLERAVGAQFIIISLRNNMFELAHQLVGICKIHDCTRSVVLNPASIASMITARAQRRRLSDRRQPRSDDAGDAAASTELKMHRAEQ